MNEISLEYGDFVGEELKKSDLEMINNERKNSESEMNLILFGKNLNMTKSQLISIILLSLAFFLNWAYFSLFAPFFPVEAIKKQMNSTQIGIIFGVFQLVLLILSPIFGKYVIIN